MATKPTCLVCQKEMEVGFFVDVGFVQAQLPRWFPGVPKLGFHGAVPEKNHPGHVILAYRCPECEALRLYAPSTEDKT